MDQHQYDHNKGFVLLVSVFVFGAILSLIVISMTYLGVSQALTSLAAEQSVQARALASACAEEALQQIHDFVPFSGTGSLTLSTGVCDYTVTVLTGQNREIQATGVVGTVIRKVIVMLDTINPSINITSWQEVADF